MTCTYSTDQWKHIFVYFTIICNFGFIYTSDKDFNLMGLPGEGYFIGVEIGTPPQNFNVLLDTGSTNFAIAGTPHPDVDLFYKLSNSSTYKAKHQEVSVFYTKGHWSGELGNDIVNFPFLKVHQVQCDIVLIHTSHSFFVNGSRWQGILGLAYPSILQPETNHNILSWLDSIQLTYSNSSSPVFSLELCGPKPLGNTHYGRFRVDDEVNTTDKLLTTPVIKEWFYEVLITDIVIGNKSINLPCSEYNNDKTVVDSGTSNLRLPKKIFDAVVNTLSEFVSKDEKTFSRDFWKYPKNLCLNEELNRTRLPNISLKLLHTSKSFFTLEITAESYFRIVHDSEVNPHKFCYQLAIESSETGSVLGVVILEGFHVVFNQTGKTVGFEKSNCGPPVSIFGPLNSEKDLWSCKHLKEVPNISALTVLVYTILGLVCAFAATVLICFFKWFLKIVWNTKLSVPHHSSQTILISEE